FNLPNHDTGRILPSKSQVKVTDSLVNVTDSSVTDYDSADESSICSTHLSSLEKLVGVEPVSGPKTIKSILKSNSTFKAENLKGVTINEPTSAPAKGNKNVSSSKKNSAPAGKLKNVKTKDDNPLSVVKKELNDLKLQISKNQSSYSSFNKPQQGHNTIISLRRGIKPKNPQHVTKSCETCGSTVYTTTDHNDIEWFRRGEALQAKKVELSNANKSKTPTKSFNNLNYISSISFMATLAPQDRWYKEKHIELVNIVGNPRTGMLIRAMSKELSAASAYECLFIDFLPEEEPKKVSEALKHPGWIKQSERGISINQENYAKDLMKKYDINGSSVKTPMVPPNNLGPDLNGRAINRTQYRDIKQIPKNLTLLLLREFSGKALQYNAKVLEKSNKAWFSTPTWGIKGEVGVTSFRNAIGENYLGHSKGYVEPPTLEVVREWILTIWYSGTIKATCTLKKGFLPPRMVPKGTKPRAKTRRRKKSNPSTMNNPLSKIEATKSASLSNEATGSPTSHSKKRKQSGTAKDTNPSQPLASTLVIARMHKKVQQATNGPVYLEVTASTIVHFESASRHDASADSTSEADRGKTAPNDSLSQQQGTKKEANYVQDEFNTSTELTNSNDATKENKLEDLPKMVKDVGIDLMGLDSPKDDLPFIVQSNKEDTSIPTELKELPSKFKEISREIRYLKSLNKKVVKMNNQKLEVSNGLLALQVQVSYITAQLSKLEVLDALPSLLNKVTKVINRFATAITSTSQTTDDTSVLSAGQVGTHPVEEKKNTQQATITHLLKTTPQPKREQVKNKAKEAMCYKEVEEKESESDSDTEIRLTDCMVESSKKKRLKKFAFVDEQDLIDLLGFDVVKNMYKAKKVYMEDESDETIQNFKAIDLNLEELKLDFSKPLGEQDPIIKLNDLAKKKRKHADDLHYYFRSTKRYKSPVKYEDHPAGTILNEQSLGMILFNSHQRQDFVSIEDFEDLSNEMLYTMQEIFFRFHQVLGQDDLARTFNSFLVAEVDKRNLNPLKQMRVIEQLRHSDEIENTACELIEKYPSMARATEKENSIPLKMIAGRSNAYFSWKEQLPLLQAILTGEWKKVRDIKHAPTVRLNDDEDTPLHVAISTCRNFQVVQNLLDEMDSDLLPNLKNKDGMHPLHRAALVGNLDAAKMLVKKNPSLLFIPDNRYFLPIHRAIFGSHEKTFDYLMTVTKKNIDEHRKNKEYQCPFEGANKAALLNSIIGSGYFDTACELIEKYPGMARATEKENSIPLKMIAGRSNAYFSATQYNFYQKFVYDHVPLRNDNLYNAGKKFDVENQGKGAATSVANGRRSCFHSVMVRIYVKFWELTLLYVPHIKQLQEEKQKHNKALKVLKYICKEVGKTDDDNVIRKHYTEAVIHALEHDNSEAIEEVVRSFPRAIWTKHNGYGLIHSAVINRCKNVYSYLVHGEIGDKHTHKICTDNDGNNLLHLAGKLAPIDKLNQISGAALQMQREIQWFEEVKKFALPRHSRREHEQLRKDGEEWMKKTADSYTVTAALIITIVFAAAITVPGGNDGNSGEAIYARKNSFIIFAISDSISLFTSTTSLLLFLSILTARYQEEDFLKRLPERLILGLAMLFLSLPLLVDLISSTYGQGIFPKHKDIGTK
nr:ankyrin repeat family protein [Tanacetum cinerariifolium]